MHVISRSNENTSYSNSHILSAVVFIIELSDLIVFGLLMAQWTLLLLLKQTQVMTHLWTLLSASLLVLSGADLLDSPEDNEVLKHTEGELTQSQASDGGSLLVCACQICLCWM